MSKALPAMLMAAVLTLCFALPAQAQQTFTVTTTSDSGPGSLRQAMTDANDASGLPADTIAFDLPASASGYDAATGTWAFSLTSDLPDIVDPVWLDGATQSGYTDRPLVDLIDAILTITYGSGFEDGSDSFVGGLVLGGISVNGPNRVEIRGNYVGTDALGESGRGGSGIELSTAFDVVIAQNVISGNGKGINIVGFGGVSADITGNFIGTNAVGDAAVPNGTGISLGGNAADAVIGGTSEADRNVISGNSGNGIKISEGTGNVILGNYIGTNAAGDAPLPNGGDGIYLTFDSFANRIGGVAPGAGNLISGNEDAGVRLAIFTDFLFTGNDIRGNSIYENGGLGIDLGSEGPTSNDPGDSDKGPNGLQNFPVLSSADYDVAASEVTVAYRVDSDPYYAGYPIAVDFYLADVGEGRTYLGTDSYTESDFASGADKTAIFAPAAPVTAGDSLIATATSGDGTSEFSAPVELVFSMIADTTPPVCGPINVERNAEGALTAVMTSAFDPESGIASVVFTTLRNLEGFLDGSGGYVQGDTESFDPAATETVQIRGERLDFAQGGAILTTVTNGAGLAAQCDPVVEQLSAEVPQQFTLEGSYPNPFRTATRIGFSLAEASPVRLEVYDLLGRKVATLVNEALPASTYEVEWTGRDAAGRAVASGVYVYRLEAGSFSATRRMTVVR